VVLRTFFKAFGMAGLSAGAALGRPDLLAKLRPYGSDMQRITGLAAATASLKVKALVDERKAIITQIREDVLQLLNKKNIKHGPGESNKFMMEVGRPGGEVAKALEKHKIFIGRVWPVWPRKVRVSIGTREEMNRFQDALMKLMA